MPKPTAAADPRRTVRLLTPPGRSAVAVVELRGDPTPLLQRHFSRPDRPDRGATYGRWRDAAGDVDDPLVVPTAGGAEVHLHGGPRIVRRVLDAAIGSGWIAHAEADDPPMLRHVLRARTTLTLQMLLAQPQAWRRLEGGLCAAETGLAAAADPTLRTLLAGVRVAVVGRANVGKSTLVNRLLGSERSIVADAPGTTRDWVGHDGDLNGLPVTFVDTPGTRPDAPETEQRAARISQKEVAAADVVLHVVDASRPADMPTRVRGLLVATKVDVAPAPEGAIGVSGLTGEGIDALAEAVFRTTGINLTVPDRAQVVDDDHAAFAAAGDVTSAAAYVRWHA